MIEAFDSTFSDQLNSLQPHQVAPLTDKKRQFISMQFSNPVA